VSAGPLVTVLIGSPLGPEHAQRVVDHRPERLSVIYEPDLLPVARYDSDHTGVARDLGSEDVARWKRHLADAEVMFDFDWLDPRALSKHAPQLRWVQATSSGIGSYLARTGLADTDITFTTAAGIHATPLAEFVVLGLLYFTKDVVSLREWQAERHWERYATRELAGQRALVVGLGGVGSHVARTLACLGLDVWGMARSTRPALPEGVTRLISRDELADSLPSVDALVLACPYTSDTHHLIGAREIAALPRSAVLVNIARGQVVDEPALVDALSSGRLAGAALDVFEQEPLPADSPLWGLPNVLVSPHSASTVTRENDRLVDLFLDNLDRYLDGRPLRNVFDRARTY
jgi:phosphoglycerate dehydrogenase-like enzyme